ncbi:hypothetical protein EYV94_08700 [Puteibacter caeruleilacunae]|nr:hypothetical protein EYV94_08700 [Puteibacter caeruleilacunae]
MKKLLAIITLIMLVSASIFAQNSDFIPKTEKIDNTGEKLWIYSITMGPSFPLGDLKNMSTTGHNSGFAETGFFVDLSGDLPSLSAFGFTASLHLHNFTVDEVKTSQKLLNRLEKSYRDVTQAEIDTMDFSTDYWLWGALLAGTKWKYPIKKGMNIELRALTGLQLTRIPVHQLYFEDHENPTTLFHTTVVDDNAFSIPVVVGANVNFKLNPKFSIKLNVDYYWSQVKYEIEDITWDKVNREELASNRSEYKIKTTALNAGIGLVYYLDHEKKSGPPIIINP